MVSIQGICKSYGDQQILKDVNIDIKKGGFVSLVGKSGSGKSTLLNIIGGLERADAGSVFFMEKISTHIPIRKWPNTIIRMLDLFFNRFILNQIILCIKMLKFRC